MSGTLIGVSLGPGDPDLITPAAITVIKSANVIAHMHATTRAPAEGMARTMAGDWVQANANEIAIAVDMSAPLSDRRQTYQAGVKKIEAELCKGNDVAFLCEGDGLVYGSLIHVLERLSPDFSVRIIAGISSVQAATAATGLALASDDTPYSVVPATAGAPALASAFAGGGGVAVIKIAKRLNDLKSVAAANGRLAAAKLVSFASTPQQKVEPLSEAESAPYFSLALFPPLSQREIPVA
ncbi:MAG: hypothetical protein KAI73_12485, partial [Rhodospirillaceae bacterium]|nr:hypothetical protein [Rhodospirillaceae bacterium]